MVLTREQLEERWHECHRLIALHRASLELVKDVSLETLLERIATTACEQVNARYAALGVLDDAGTLKQFISVGLTEEEIKRIPHPPVGKGLIGALMNAEEPIRLTDLQRDPRSVGFPAGHPRMRSFLGVPIRQGEQRLGQIYLTEKMGHSEFTVEDEYIIQMLANYAAVAIQNARLHFNARRLAVLEERERIGMDLHDGIIQSIYGVGLTLEHARLLLAEDTPQAQERLQQAIRDLNQTIRDIRTYILDLRPRQLQSESLMEGLQRLVTEYRMNTLAEALLAGPKNDLANLPQGHALALFHVCQEALANVAKHAYAKRVNVSLWTTADRVLLEVKDDGHGFDLQKMSMTLGHGLSNMYTRLHNVGGDVDIVSAVGEGTTILAWVPRTENQSGGN